MFSFVNLLSLLPSLVLNIVAIILFIIFFVDFLISFNVIFSFRKFADNVRKESTDEINKLVKKVISSKSILGKRLMQTFPSFELSIKELKQKN